ncbi:MAG: hypothetical protein O3B72_04150 [Proteobacteria bacterium]|nr:hypothetical protein [Pseudomonadota bacterium]
MSITLQTAESIERLVDGQFDRKFVDEAAYKMAWQGESADRNPFDAAFTGGMLADRLSWVFVAAYQSALRACFPLIPDRVYSTFAVSENTLDAALPGTSLDASGRLVGTKTWIASSRLVDHLVVTLGPGLDGGLVAAFVGDGAGDGVKLTHRDNPGFLGDMSQGFATFEGTPCTPVLEHRATSFGLAEPFFIAVAGTGYLLREFRRLNLPRQQAAAEQCLPALWSLYGAGFDSDVPLLLELYEAVAGLGKACAAETGNRVGDGDIARDWSANGRLLGMYGGGLRRRVSRRS